MIAIAELAPADARRIVPLFDQVQRMHVAAHPDIFRADTPDGEKEAFLREWLSREAMTALVALSEDGTALGYLIYEIRVREASAVQRASRTGFLHHIAVDEACRGRRIGARLVAAMKDRLRAAGVGTIQSDHYAFNDASAALMRSAGLAPLRIAVRGTV